MAGRVRGKWFGDVACGQFLAPDQSQNLASGGLDQRFRVVGATCGLGLGVAQVFSAASASVMAIARGFALASGPGPSGGSLQFIHADHTDPVIAGTLLAVHQLDVLRS